MSSTVLAAVFGALYLVLRRRDRRLLRNGFLLVGALFFGLVAVLHQLVDAAPVLGLVVVGLLALLLRDGGGVGRVLAAVLVFVTSYLGGVFVAFLVYSLVYVRMSFETRPEAVVVLGSKTIHGQVPPLLRSRLDTALRVYRSTAATGRAPLLIPSGGQGEDETRSEGAAMAEYLLDQGADPADVRPEEQATTTRENLLLAAAVQREAGRAGPAIAVTNNYPTLRAP